MNLRTGAMAVILMIGMGACGDDAGPAVPTVQEEERLSEVVIVATDFAFELSKTSFPAGTLQTTLINEGEQAHQAGYYLLNEGVSFEEFMAEVLEDDSAIPQLASGGRAGHVRGLSPGESGVRPGDDLEPGTYAVLCSVRDLESGKNHYEIGMAASFEVH